MSELEKLSERVYRVIEDGRCMGSLTSEKAAIRAGISAGLLRAAEVAERRLHSRGCGCDNCRQWNDYIAELRRMAGGEK